MLIQSTFDVSFQVQVQLEATKNLTHKILRFIEQLRNYILIRLFVMDKIFKLKKYL